MTPFLFRHRDRMLALWALGCLVLSLPPRGWPLSLVPLAAGSALRVWSRRYIGPHSRGREFAAPYRCVGGPYRFLAHPLYAANLLVAAGLALQLRGPEAGALACLAGPSLLYAFLARAEGIALRRADPPVRRDPLAPGSARLRSEWASHLPALLAWLLLGAFAR